MRTIPVLLAYMSLWLLMQTPLVAQDPTILVSGKASLEAVPDRVQFNFFSRTDRRNLRTSDFWTEPQYQRAHVRIVERRFQRR